VCEVGLDVVYILPENILDSKDSCYPSLQMLVDVRERTAKIRWAMADIVKKWNFKVGAGPIGQFDRDSEDTVLSSHCLICKVSCYYRLNLT
jgi:hypothetical protein